MWDLHGVRKRVVTGVGLLVLGTVAQGLLASEPAFAAFIGWQTFSTCSNGNSSGICDDTPESNSTYDETPLGDIGSASTYLTGVIGQEASLEGQRGRGQNEYNQMLNGDGFGDQDADSTRLITEITLADGTPGQRIGAYGTNPTGAPNGTSVWKFSTNSDGRTGDVRITNESDYYFRVDFIHFDARVGRENSPKNLEIQYLSGDGTVYDNALTRKDTGVETVDLYSIYNHDFGLGPGTFDVSHDLGGATGTQVFLAPDASLAFRLLWTDFRNAYAESQLDNIAVEGRFFRTADLLVEVDPVSATLEPTNYYVSSSAGSDDADGLTEESAFQSLGHVNALPLEPGDQVLFKSGDVWQGMFWPRGSGTAAYPIRIGSYGGSVKPIIDGDGYQASLLIVDDEYYEVENLELTNQASHLDQASQVKGEADFQGAENDDGSGENVRFGVKVLAAGRSISGFSFSNLDIHDVYPTPSDPGKAHQGYGIKFESQSDVDANEIYTISDIDMDGLTVSRTGHYGIWVRPLGLNGIDDYKHDDITLRNSTFLDTGGSGFVPAKASNVLVEGNLFDGTGSHLDARMWQRGSGLWAFDSTNVLIQNNTVRNARGPMDSYGVHIDYNNENVVVQYNYSYNNEGGFVQILGGNTDCGYRYNISVGDGYRVQGVDGGLQSGRLFNVSNYCNVNAGCPSVGNFIHNNTVFVPNTFSPEIVFKAGSGETLFYNNVIYVQDGSAVLQTQIAGSGVTYDIRNNLFYPPGLFSLATELSNEAVYFDPQLRDPGADDPAMYKLLPGSPAKSAGTWVAGSEDFFGLPVSSGSPAHLGAYNGDETFDLVSVPLLGWPALLLLTLGLGFSGIRRSSSR